MSDEKQAPETQDLWARFDRKLTSVDWSIYACTRPNGGANAVGSFHHYVPAALSERRWTEQFVSGKLTRRRGTRREELPKDVSDTFLSGYNIEEHTLLLEEQVHKLRAALEGCVDNTLGRAEINKVLAETAPW